MGAISAIRNIVIRTGAGLFADYGQPARESRASAGGL